MVHYGRFGPMRQEDSAEIFSPPAPPGVFCRSMNARRSAGSKSSRRPIRTAGRSPRLAKPQAFLSETRSARAVSCRSNSSAVSRTPSAVVMPLAGACSALSARAAPAAGAKGQESAAPPGPPRRVIGTPHDSGAIVTSGGRVVNAPGGGASQGFRNLPQATQAVDSEHPTRPHAAKPICLL